MAKKKALLLCLSMINSESYAKNMGINARRLTLTILVKADFILIDRAKGIKTN